MEQFVYRPDLVRPAEGVSSRSLIVLFGIPGAGKNTVGELLGRKGYHFYDADSDVPQAMLESVQNNIPPTDELRDEYAEIIIKRTGALLAVHEKVAVAQAFIKDRQRQMVFQAFPSATFVLVQAERDVAYKRVQERKGAILSGKQEYAEFIIRAFEEPTIPYITIENNGVLDELEHSVNKLVLAAEQA